METIVELPMEGDRISYACRFEFTYKQGIPARFSGHPDTWHPEEPDEVEITEAEIEVADDLWVKLPDTTPVENQLIDQVLREIE